MAREPEDLVYAVLSTSGTRYFASEHELATALAAGLRGEVRVFLRAAPRAVPNPPPLCEILQAEIDDAFDHRFEPSRPQYVRSLATAIRQVVYATLQPLPQRRRRPASPPKTSSA